MKSILVALLVILLTPAALAEGYMFTGEELYEACNEAKTPKSDYSFCAGFIGGFIDSTAFYSNNPAFCLPDGSNMGQWIKTVFKRLQSRPADRKLSAALLVNAALRDAYPCK